MRPSHTDPAPYASNGLHGGSGDYLWPPLTVEQVATAARGPAEDPLLLRILQRIVRQRKSPGRALQEGHDPKKLEEAGWGVVFPANSDSKPLCEALRPLLDLRREQATRRHERYYREFRGDDGYREGDSKLVFLGRHGAAPGPIDPEKVPYYLLLVGDPDAIPFSFQYQLDVPHAVGRLHFATLEEYAHYAESVVAAETAAHQDSVEGAPETRPSALRRAVFFGASNPGDPATQVSASHLVRPLAECLAGRAEGWKIESCLGEGATRDRLGQLLGRDRAETPSFLFAACHGVGFDSGDPRQLDHQGSLVCQDWPGPRGGGLTRDHWFAAEDVEDGARPSGLVAFFFACYGAGTPTHTDFPPHRSGEPPAIAPPTIAPHPFLARLPQRLLGHPQGGALAVVGHVERAWDYSFLWEDTGSQIGTFYSALLRLLDGHPVGSAMEWFDLRYAEMEAALSSERDRPSTGQEPRDGYLAGLWTAARDARNYTVLGDPAVRVVGSGQAPAEVRSSVRARTGART